MLTSSEVGSPPISHKEAARILNQTFFLLEQYLSSAFITNAEKKSLDRIYTNLQTEASLYLESLPYKKNNHFFDEEALENASSQISSKWNRFKGKVKSYSSKDILLLMQDIIPEELEKIGTSCIKLIKSTPVSSKKQQNKLKTEIANEYSSLEDTVNFMLEKISKNNFDTSLINECRTDLLNFRTAASTRFDEVFRAVELQEEGGKRFDKISYHIDRILTLLNRVNKKQNKSTPKEIQQANELFQKIITVSFGTLEVPSDSPKPPRKRVSIASQFTEILENQKSPVKRNTSFSSSSSGISYIVEDEEVLKEKIARINAEADEVSKRNRELQKQIILSTNSKSNSKAEIDEIINAYLRTRLSELNLQISKAESTIRERRIKMDDAAIKLNEQIKKINKKTEKISIEIKRIEEETAPLILEEDTLRKKRRDLVQRAATVRAEYEDLKKRVETESLIALEGKEESEDGEEAHQKIMKEKQNQLDALKNELAQLRGLANGDPAREIYERVAEEQAEIERLRRECEEMENEKIPDLLFTIQMTSSLVKQSAESIAMEKAERDRRRIEESRRILFEQNYL